MLGIKNKIQVSGQIRRENIQGEERAINTHAQVGREVREAIHRMGNTMPEDLPAEPPIREIEKRLGPALPPPADATK
jgi:DNA-damage-inducible protein D